MFEACLLPVALALVASLPASVSTVAIAIDAHQAPAPATALAQGPAGCVVQVGERVLMVRDIWSHRFGLPGGGSDPGESGQQAAERETFEETGLRVVAHAPLWTTPGGFTAYSCAPTDAGIVTHPDGTLVLPKAGYDELIEARFVNLAQVPDAKLRFPSQRAALQQATGGPGLPDAVLRAPPLWGPWFTSELPVIRAVQKALQTVFGTHTDALMQALSGLGSTAGVLLVMALVWFLVGWRAGVELGYVLFLTILAGLVAKQVFGWPRPFHVDPSVGREVIASFGFPSGHTVCAAALWGTAALRTRFAARYWVFGACVFLCALSRVALGVHFIHDVVAGTLLGGMACAAYRAHCAFYRVAQVRLRTWWAASLGMCLGTLAVHPQPTTIGVCAALVTLGLGSACLALLEGPKQTNSDGVFAAWALRPNWRQRLVHVGVTCGLATLILRCAPMFLPVESSFLPQLYVHIATYLALGALLPAVELTARILQPAGACASHVA